MSLSRKRDKPEHKHLKKFLELGRDPLKRLKWLTQGLEKSNEEETKAFYMEYSSSIFYCIYSSFTIVEANIHDKVAKGKGYSDVFMKDMMDIVLPSLQKVIEFLPELIHRKWQYNSICTIMRKLFHPQNGLKMRQFGIKLLVLWIQGLQENAGEACTELFSSAIPHFPPKETALPVNNSTNSAHCSLQEHYGMYSNSPSRTQTSIPRSYSVSGSASCMKDAVHVGVLYPLSLPPPATLDDETITMELMDHLLKCLTSQLHSLHWEEEFKYVRGFSYLFYLFKLSYLAPLYQQFRTGAGLYTQPHLNGMSMSGGECVEAVEPAEVSELTQSTPPTREASKHRHRRTSPHRMSAVIKLDYNTSHPIYAKIQDLILKYVLMWVLPMGKKMGVVVDNSPSSSPMLPRRSKLLMSGSELMREMWYTNRDNVNLLLEICRVGFQTPLSKAPTLRKLIDLYFHWEQTAQKPPFMCSPPVQSHGETTPPTPSLILSSNHSVAKALPILSWEQLSCYEGFKPTAVQAGLQSSLRMIVIHTSQVFTKSADSREELNCQVEMCKKIIRLYQGITMTGDMDQTTWEHTVSVMLNLTKTLLPATPPSDRDSTLGGTLADTLLKTLLGYYLRASMAISLPPLLWEELLGVVSSLTQWREVIREWQFVMVSMTKVLAQAVYGLCLNDLPLDKLERGESGGRRANTSKDSHLVMRLDSFSNIYSVTALRRSLRRDTADAQLRFKAKKLPLMKSATEIAKESPTMEGHPGPVKRPSLPNPEQIRPLGLIVQLGSLAEAGEDNPSPSPGAESLPSGYPLLRSTAIDEDSNSEHSLASKGSVYMNTHTSTPSPDAVRAHKFSYNEQSGKSAQKRKGLKHRLGHGPPDLIFNNENTEPKRSRHSSDSPKLHTVSDLTQSVSVEETDSSVMRQRKVGIRKSSSEGNIHRIALSGDLPSPGPSQVPAHSIRRVASITVNNEESSTPLMPSHSKPRSPDSSGQSRFRTTSPPLSPLRPQGGWSAESAAIVWQRMLRVVGDVNDISDPDIHSEAMCTIEDTWGSLCKIMDNLGIPVGSSPTPPLPDYIPPLSILLPCVVRACSLPHSHLGGRLIAYKLLCQMFIRHWHTPASPQDLALFYSLMHHGLQPHSDVVSIVVRHGCGLFSHCLPGASVLIRDSLAAVRSMLSSPGRASIPRQEALLLLGSLLNLPDQTPPVADHTHLKTEVMELLYQAARTEPLRSTRCLAVFQVGQLLYTELVVGGNSTLPDGLDIILASLQFMDKSVTMASVDMLSMLAELCPQIIFISPHLPARVLLSLSYAIAVLLCEGCADGSWQERVLVSLVLCLRDWLVALPTPDSLRQGGLETSILETVFEVLQAAAGASDVQVSLKNPVWGVQLTPLEAGSLRSTPSSRDKATPRPYRRAPQDIQLSCDKLSPQLGQKLKVAARCVLTHLLNLLGHFPFACGAAQMSSAVCEHHDSPSLQHLSELSPEIFDSPRVQFFSFNNQAIVSCIEIPTQTSGLPSSVKSANYQTRVIVRDVSGKYTWDCVLLYGPDKPSSPYEPAASLTDAVSMDSLSEYTRLINKPLPQATPPSVPADPLQPPSWRTHHNSGSDVLEDLLTHVERTSPECLFQGVGLCEAVPVSMREEGMRGTEESLVQLIEQQSGHEGSYIEGTRDMPSMQGSRAVIPKFYPSPLAFHHCRLFLSHLGLLSWERRDHLDLLEKSNHLILELKHLDNIQAQTRQTYKVAVLYIAPGQEDKGAIFSNSRGSRNYEEFLSGLGWEVDMSTHSGYMGGLKREFCADCTLPYHATSSEEVLFHVATRLPLKMDQKVRHLGNDFVHIVWSEHWRDYRRTTFKTSFGDVLIVIYPQRNGLFRVQINIEKKSNVSQFGPLFDGALVTRESLPGLVRATAINALRAVRSSLLGSRGRFEERLQNISNITDKKLRSSFEEFSESVMHPLEMSTAQLTAPGSLRETPHKLRIPPSITHQRAPPTDTPTSHQSVSSSRSHSPKVTTAFLKIPTLKEKILERWSPPTRRHRSSTNDDRMTHPPKVMRRNCSVPENLSDIGRSVSAPSAAEPLEHSQTLPTNNY